MFGHIGTARLLRRAAVVLAAALLVPVVQWVSPATAAPSDIGSWTTPFNLPLVAIHSTLLHTGKVLLFEKPHGTQVGSLAYLWDPTTGVTTNVGIPRARDVFCAGHSVLPNGDVLVTGGHPPGGSQGLGVWNVDVFHTDTNQWQAAPIMSEMRWYPTNIELPSGKILIFGGQKASGIYSKTVESYDPASGTISTLPSSATLQLPLYPRMFLTPSGQLFEAGPNRNTRMFDPATSTWRQLANTTASVRNAGTAVLLPGLNEVLAVGGFTGSGTLNSAEIIDLSAPIPTWRAIAPMHFARRHLNATLLPDGTVLVVGGGNTGNFENPVMSAEIFDPVTETWTVMAAQTASRMYHSTAILLPDGRILSAGQNSGVYAKTGEIYSPPYLFKGARPTIASAPANLGYGQMFDVQSPDAASIRSVTLMRPGSVTHSINMDQRYVGMDFSVSGSTLTVTGPSSPNTAPPGWYMLFLVSQSGVPSIASWVHVA